jgi:hypothetical protein
MISLNELSHLCELLANKELVIPIPTSQPASQPCLHLSWPRLRLNMCSSAPEANVKFQRSHCSRERSAGKSGGINDFIAGLADKMSEPAEAFSREPVI